MITTKIENSLRNGLFGVFGKFYEKEDRLIWQALLSQRTENNLLINGDCCIVPDRYLMSVSSGNDEVLMSKETCAHLMKCFVKEFAEHSGYDLNNEVSIDWIVKNTNNPFGMSIHAWVFKSAGVKAEVIKINDGNKRVGEFRLAPGEKIIAGRNERCTVVLNDKYISDQHAVIAADQMGKIHIIDLHSANGTYISGKRQEPFVDYKHELPKSVFFGSDFEVKFYKNIAMKPGICTGDGNV